jgi:hypothetical protein
VKRFLSATRLWILLLPLAIGYLGAASNQVVLWANHDKFPVRLNAYKTAVFHAEIASADLPSEIKTAILSDDLIDPVHCVMSDSTHLNLLADWIDLHTAIYSPGDLLIESGDWAWDYTPMLWGILFCVDALRRKQAVVEVSR